MVATLMQQRCLSGYQVRQQQASKSAVGARNILAPTRQRRLAHGSQCRRVTTMGLFGLGLPEVAVVAGIAVLVFGPSKLPELGKELGKTVKSFQTAAKEFETELKNAADDTADKIEEKSEQLKDEARK